MKIIKSVLISLLFVPLLVFAQNQVILPSAGLTPQSPFYFIDKFGEALREFFTLNPESKARLQITFVTERIAEIKVILKTKGVEAKGLEVAQFRLQAHLANAATIVIDQKAKGRDASELAKELDNKFEETKFVLAQTFKEQGQTLEAKGNELKVQLKAAHSAGDAEKEDALAQELDEMEIQLGLLESKEENIQDELIEAEEKLAEEIEAQYQAEKVIEEAEEARERLIIEAAEKGVELPGNAFVEFDSFFGRAKNAFENGDYEEAERLAEKTEYTLELIEGDIDEAEQSPDDTEDLEEQNKEENEQRNEGNEDSEQYW